MGAVPSGANHAGFPATASAACGGGRDAGIPPARGQLSPLASKYPRGLARELGFKTWLPSTPVSFGLTAG